MKHPPSSAAALAMLFIFPFSTFVNAIVMLHDHGADYSLPFGRPYPPTGTVRPADAAKGLGAEGTLIHPRWVLTAAHVAAEVGPDDLVEVDGKILRIDRVVRHPEWHQVSDLKRDIALIHLKSSVKHIRP